MIDHYEIQSRRLGGEWEHIGNVYPDYKWEIRRPWFFLWLVRRPRVINPREALLQTTRRLTKLVMELWKNDNGDETRFILWCRGPFGRLQKTKMLEV